MLIFILVFNCKFENRIAVVNYFGLSVGDQSLIRIFKMLFIYENYIYLRKANTLRTSINEKSGLDLT